MSRYLWRGWVTTQLTAPEFHVTYPGLWWVRPLPAPWMHLVLVVTAIAGFGLALGWRQRWSAALALLGFGWVESVDAATYLNHYELVTLMLALCVALPMSDAWSLDRRAGRRGPRTGEPGAGGTVAVGVVWAMRAQLGVVYVFAALAKVQADWLVHGQPLTTWLAARTDVPLVGGLFINPSVGLALSWAGATFDLLVVPALLWKRTRAAAYVAVVVFHVVTGLLFPRIGVFPWLMIALTPIFFDPNWPARALGRFHRSRRAPTGSEPHANRGTDARPVRYRVVAVALVIVAVEIALPLRHLVIPGDVRWSEEGYRWSWRVLVTERSGVATFHVTDPGTGRSAISLPSDHLTPQQVTYVSSRPEAIRQYAHFVAGRYAEMWHLPPGSVPVVTVDAWVSVNGSARSRIVDPTVDLARASPALGRPSWVLPARWERENPGT